MRINISGEVRSDYRGFAGLIKLAERTRDCVFDNIDIDMKNVKWLDANMCATFGAVLYKMGREPNIVTLSNIPGKIGTILSKNGFLSHYGREKKRDTYRTTIEYKRFEPRDDRYFAAYIKENLVGKGIPEMSQGLRKKFVESIFEIFSNAVIHSKTQMGIFSCGQFFPVKKRLDFSISDLGIGIRQNVKEHTRQDLTAEEAINWAMEGRNTTKVGRIPGGLGLKLLREFITMNKGKIQIVSDKGYWELSGGKTSTKTGSSGLSVGMKIA